MTDRGVLYRRICSNSWANRSWKARWLLRPVTPSVIERAVAASSLTLWASKRRLAVSNCCVRLCRENRPTVLQQKGKPCLQTSDSTVRKTPRIVPCPYPSKHGDTVGRQLSLPPLDTSARCFCRGVLFSSCPIGFRPDDSR